MEGSLPDSASLASLLDQLALVQYLGGKLPEAEAAARRMSEAALKLFGEDEAAVAMCSLRLGTVLAGKHLAIFASPGRVTFFLLVLHAKLHGTSSPWTLLICTCFRCMRHKITGQNRLAVLFMSFPRMKVQPPTALAQQRM